MTPSHDWDKTGPATAPFVEKNLGQMSIRQAFLWLLGVVHCRANQLSAPEFRPKGINGKITDDLFPV